MAIGACASLERPRAGGIEPLTAVALLEAQDAQILAIALLGMRTTVQCRANQRLDVRADLAAQAIKRDGVHSRCFW